MSAPDTYVPTDESSTVTLDEENIMQLRNLMHEQIDARADIAAVEKEIDRCVLLEIVPSWDTLRDWCERLSDAAESAAELPDVINYLLHDLDEQS